MISNIKKRSIFSHIDFKAVIVVLLPVSTGRSFLKEIHSREREENVVTGFCNKYSTSLRRTLRLNVVV